MNININNPEEWLTQMASATANGMKWVGLSEIDKEVGPAQLSFYKHKFHAKQFQRETPHTAFIYLPVLQDSLKQSIDMSRSLNLPIFSTVDLKELKDKEYAKLLSENLQRLEDQFRKLEIPDPSLRLLEKAIELFQPFLPVALKAMGESKTMTLSVGIKKDANDDFTIAMYTVFIIKDPLSIPGPKGMYKDIDLAELDKKMHGIDWKSDETLFRMKDFLEGGPLVDLGEDLSDVISQLITLDENDESKKVLGLLTLRHWTDTFFEPFISGDTRVERDHIVGFTFPVSENYFFTLTEVEKLLIGQTIFKNLQVGEQSNMHAIKLTPRGFENGKPVLSLVQKPFDFEQRARMIDKSGNEEQSNKHDDEDATKRKLRP